jgi:hypothetical protein
MMRSKTATPWGCVALAALGLIATRINGQTQTETREPAPLVASTELPDSPGALLNRTASETAFDADPLQDPTKTAADSAGYIKWAPMYHRTVHPDERAHALTPMDKLKLSIMSRLTPGEAASTVLGAAWSQARNSRPNYGTDRGAFGERMGALAIKQTSQAFFSYGLFPALLHQDPRYYILGDTRPFKRRLAYSAVTVVITQNDQGNSVINWSRLAGIAAATALTTAYYPVENHGFGNESKAYLASLGTAALNSELHEFGGDIIHLVHHKH